MSSSKVTVLTIALSLSALLAGCAETTDTDTEGNPSDTARAAVDGAENDTIGTTSSAMTTLAVCASGTNPNAKGNLTSAGAVEDFFRTKSIIEWCELGSLNRRDAIVDFSTSYQPHTYQFTVGPNVFGVAGAPKFVTPKDPVSCAGVRLETKFQKEDGGQYVDIVPKVVKKGVWKGDVITGYCEAPSHVFTRINMVDSSTTGPETTTYRIVAKVERLGGVPETVWIRGRNFGNGF